MRDRRTPWVICLLLIVVSIVQTSMIIKLIPTTTAALMQGIVKERPSFVFTHYHIDIDYIARMTEKGVEIHGDSLMKAGIMPPSLQFKQ